MFHENRHKKWSKGIGRSIINAQLKAQTENGVNVSLRFHHRAL